MKKSCLEKESKVVRNEDIETTLNDSKEYSKKQLISSDTEEDDLGWVEKKNFFKTINVSVNTAGSERHLRSSPRLAKIGSSRPAKWIENSFEIMKKEDSQNNVDNNNDKIPKTRSNKDSQQLSNISRTPNSLFASKEQSQEFHKTAPKTDKKRALPDTCDKLGNDSDINGDSPKSSKRVYYIKVQVEGGSNKEYSISAEGNGNEESFDDNQGLITKKRASPPVTDTVDTAKKLKMEPPNYTNGMCVDEENSLKIELELKRNSVPFKIRDIRTIVSECEFRIKKWKENFLKYKWPVRWGTPVVRNCSEKWDGKQIPQKLLQRYQKYLSSNNLLHPVFLPTNLQNNTNLNKSSSEVSSQSNTSINFECRDESGNDFKEISESEGSFIQEDKNKCALKNSSLENNLNASTSASDGDGRMVLRNRNQQKPVLVDVDSSDDDSEEWLSKQKPIKKQKINSKNKKGTVQTNQQVVWKSEKCNIYKRNGNKGNRKAGSKNDENFTAESHPGNALNQLETNSKYIAEPDTMVCPICSLRFKRQLIESHATECASKTYKD